MPDVNPISQVQSALWTLLEDNSDFTTLVPVGNRLKFDGTDPAPEKDEVSRGDLPEVRVRPVKWKGMMQHTSNSSFAELVFAVEIATGDRGVLSMFDTVFAVWRALHAWQATLGVLEWNSKTFVHGCRTLDADLDLDNKELNRRVRGWSAVWLGRIKMHFTESDL